MKTKEFYLLALSAPALACWRSAGSLFGAVGPLNGLIVLAIVLLFVSAPALAAARVRLSAWIWAGLLVLAALSLPASVVVSIFPVSLGPPLGTPMALTLLLMLSVALVIAALLLSLGLNLYQEWQNVGAIEGEKAQAQRRYVGRAAAISLVLRELLPPRLHLPRTLERSVPYRADLQDERRGA